MIILFSRKFLFFLPRIILFGAILVYIGFAFLTYFDFFEPFLYPLKFIRGKPLFITPNIIVGPYPNYEELNRLKKKYGMELVISLLNPNLPQEKALYEKEIKNCEKLGLEIVNYPLHYIPLNSDHNKKVIKELMKFLKLNSGRKVYIHCYFGRHRLKLIKLENFKLNNH